MHLFSLIIEPMIDELQYICALDLNIWCAEDGTLVGTISEIAKATDIFRATGATLGYCLEVGKSKLWWPSLNLLTNLRSPNGTPDDYRSLLEETAIVNRVGQIWPLLFPVLAEEPAPAAFRPVSGTKLLEETTGNESYSVGFFRGGWTASKIPSPPSRRWTTCAYSRRCTACAPQSYRRCTCSEPLYLSKRHRCSKKFDERQIRWENRLLHDIPDVPADVLSQASLDREYEGL